MLQRTLQNYLLEASQTFPVLLLTGPRQVGKTTLLKSLASKDMNYVTMDDLDARLLAQTDPVVFLKRFKPPMIIDEIQYAPQLFSQIKLSVDQSNTNGQFWLTGSQKFHLMHSVTESLAGRVAILELNGFSNAEVNNYASESSPFLPSDAWLNQARRRNPQWGIHEIFKKIWRGSYPRVVTQKNISIDLFYNSYLQTYIQRDLKDLIKISNESAFFQFIQVIAARTGQLINYADIANDMGIDPKTAKLWTWALEASGLVYLMRPYHNNITKKLVKTPKIYFLDTGLCCFLTKWSSPKALEAGAFSGPILETWVISELLKSYWYNGKTPHFYFYRDKANKEIDLIIEENHCLYPIEIKKTAAPGLNTIKHFDVLQNLQVPIGQGAVLCLKSSDIPITSAVDAIPIAYL